MELCCRRDSFGGSRPKFFASRIHPLRGKNNAWEPEVVELENGHLRMFIRCETPERLLWESDSFDFGRSWTPARRGSLSNPGTKVVIYKIRDCYAMINNVCFPESPNRKNLAILVSKDCRIWHKKIDLAEVVDEELPSAIFCGHEKISQIAYPHGFADDQKQMLYLALDSVSKFFMVKVPYRDILS
ncbi:MAG: sialidase family protein [Victivallaceae bacterium]|nr:sialidase family protein [Victivallaceae bacterium]